MNITEAARAAGVSVRAMRYYEEVGLLQPVRAQNSGYREYDADMVRRARLIRVWRELQFSLEEIKFLLDAPRMERDRRLQRQIERLQARRQVIDNRIALAISLRMNGPEPFMQVDFDQVDAQMQRAREGLATNAEWQTLSEQLEQFPPEEQQKVTEALLQKLADVATFPESDVPAATEALRAYIDENLYPCTPAILQYYARAFGGDGYLAEMLESLAGTGAAKLLRQRLDQT